MKLLKSSSKLLLSSFMLVILSVQSGWSRPTLPLDRWETFKAAFGQKANVRWDTKRGTPALIYNLGFPLEGLKTRDRNQIERVIRGFVAQHQSLFGINPSDLELTHTVLLEDEDWYLTYLQSYKGLRVIGGSFGINVYKGKVIFIKSKVHRDVDIASLTPSISKGQTLDIVKADLALTVHGRVVKEGAGLALFPL